MIDLDLMTHPLLQLGVVTTTFPHPLEALETPAAWDAALDPQSPIGLASIDAHGPTLADNLLIVVSGYGGFGQRPGNALLVYEVPQEVLP